VYSEQNAQYESLFLAGVNLGIGVPGTYAGELAASREQYENWFSLMAEAGINNVRIYTLHYPHFYSVLNEFNQAQVSKGLDPIYLFHGIWLDENLVTPDETDLVQMTNDFQSSIKEVINAIHGNVAIDQRYGQAFGTYTVDVSPWVMGYILGREVHPNEVSYTNQVNTGLTSFSGDVFAINNGSATEVWITQQLEYTVAYENENYQTQRPVSFTSWPTLDPIDHPTETSYEDRESLDLANIDIIDAPAGLFYSFHAYPYYPDFISEDETYRSYEDSSGKNSYVGYLEDLKSHYHMRPLLIAEFGTPSSWGNIHSAHSGIHHGGHTEEQQGVYSARMLENIFNTNMAGGMVFAMIDEWWKPTWLTNVFDFPFNRRAYWHNVLAPEQNYGLLAFDSQQSDEVALKDSLAQAWQGVNIVSVKTSHNAAYFYVSLELISNFSEGDTIVVGFNTYDNALGETILPSVNDKSVATEQGNEFALTIEFKNNDIVANYYVTPAYDLYGLWNEEHDPTVQKLSSTATTGGGWNLVKWKTNYSSFPDAESNDTFYGIEENTIFEIGKLNSSLSENFNSSSDAIAVNGKAIKIRIPWGLLQFTDPARLQVFHDDPATALRDSMTSDGISLALVFRHSLEGETEKYNWSEWLVPQEIPAITERIKPAYYAYKNAIQKLIN